MCCKGNSPAIALFVALGAAAFGQVSISYDKLDGADPGFVDVPGHLVIVDVYIDVAPTDAWTVAGISGHTENSALLQYQAGGALLSPGAGQRYVTFVSAPHPRNATARFTDGGVSLVGGLCVGGVTATATNLNAAWFALPPPSQGSPSVDGYITRLALDISGTPFTAAQCGVYDPADPPFGVPLFIADHCGTGMVAATLDAPGPVSLPWAVYAVEWDLRGRFDEYDDNSDAPEGPFFAEFIADVRFENLEVIFGELLQNDTDFYAFRISDPARFSATTMHGAAADTQLFLFDADGRAVVFSDNANGQIQQSLITPQFVPNAGMYYLAVSGYNRDPYNPQNLPIWTDTPREGERPPNGQGVNNPFLAGWSGNTQAAGNYEIYLTGVTTLCSADVNSDGMIDLADLATQLSNFGAANGARFNQGNIDGDSDVDIDDLAGLLARFGSSCL
jgi:hypothetical protein